MRTPAAHWFAAILFGLSCAASGAAGAAEPVQTIDVQSHFSPLMIEGAPRGGAHPIGGLAHVFIENANAALSAVGLSLVFRATDEVKPFDRDVIKPGKVKIPGDFASIHHAVAAGPEAKGLSAGIGLSNMIDSEAAALFVGGLPFGLQPPEFAAWLYEGGGLQLQQELYDELFDSRLVVVPIAINPAQGGGWFPEKLPDSMKSLCQTPWIVRWPSIPAGVWAEACGKVGVDVANIGERARCADTEQRCPAAGNPVEQKSDALIFGGFKPGSLPHKLMLLGHVDAFELNLPYTDVMMMKIALGVAKTRNSDADLRPIIEKTPYLYLNAWHQPYTYVELVVNRAVWEALTDDQRRIFKTAAKASTLEAWALAIDVQAEGTAILQRNGARVERWPAALLEALKSATPKYLEKRGAELGPEDNGRFIRVYEHMRAYQRSHSDYFLFGDAPRLFESESADARP